MKTKNSGKLQRLGVATSTIAVNARADELGRAVHYICERRQPGLGSPRGRLGVKTAIVMTIEQTYELSRDHKGYAKAKAAAAKNAV